MDGLWAGQTNGSERRKEQNRTKRVFDVGGSDESHSSKGSTASYSCAYYHHGVFILICKPTII